VPKYTTQRSVSSNPDQARRTRYNNEHYVIKFVSNLWFCSGTPVYSTNKTDRHNITEILLKVTSIYYVREYSGLNNNVLLPAISDN